MERTIIIEHLTTFALVAGNFQEVCVAHPSAQKNKIKNKTIFYML